MEWTCAWSGTRKVCITKNHNALKRQVRWLMLRKQRLPTTTPSMWQNMPSGWQSLRQRKGVLYSFSKWWWSSSYCEIDRPHNPGRFGENCVRNDAGELALTNVDKTKPRVQPPPPPPPPHTHTHISPSQCACDPDRQSTQQDEIDQSCWSVWLSVWYHSWDAEGCWWGRISAAKASLRLTDEVKSCWNGCAKW